MLGDGTMCDEDGVDAFALASINRAYSSRNVFVVGIDAAAAATAAASSLSSIYLHSDV